MVPLISMKGKDYTRIINKNEHYIYKSYGPIL